MPGHEPIEHPTEQQAKDAFHLWPMMSAEPKKLISTVEAYVKEHGELVLEDKNGKPYLYARRQQVYYGMVPNPTLVPAALEELLDFVDIQMVKVILDRTPANQLIKTIKSLYDGYDDLLAVMARLDPSDREGQMEMYGGVSIYKGPKPLNEETHRMLEPGDEEFKNEFVIVGESDE